MKQLNKLISDAYSIVEDIEKNSEGLDKNVLLEAVMIDEKYFSIPVDGETLLQQMKDEGLI